MNDIQNFGSLSYNLELLELLKGDRVRWEDGTNEHELKRADERIQEVNRRISSLKADAKISEMRAEAARNRHTGPVCRIASNGKTHFENSFNETFCGAGSASENPTPAAGDRAECLRCQQAGDAAKRNGYVNKVGSPASR